ncbi:MAG: DsbA family oxidoreductase [Muribaculaceae bacterium]|nr:DsbA family oxidoreductase [Muribaculaceae bacterium]
MITLAIWADFACPYSYLEEKQLFDIIKKENLSDNLKVKFLSYQLDPDAPVIPEVTMTQHFMDNHKYTEEQTEHLMKKITAMASHVGLDYKLATTQVCSTFDAHRLMEYAQKFASQETVINLNFALFHANFIQNMRLSDHQVLLSIAEKCGLDRKSVAAVLTSDEYSNQVKNDEAEIDRRKDFNLIPYMVFNNTTTLQGVISQEAMEVALGVNH